MLKIVYIGDRGYHSAIVHTSTVGDKRFCACGVAPGTTDEDITEFYEYIKNDYPDTLYFADYIEMLDHVKPDLAVVSPRFDLTATVCMECAKRGIHIYAEKAIALSRKELADLKQCVEENNVRLMAMHNLHFIGPFYEAMCMARRGEIGDVRMVNAQKSYKLGQRADFFKKRETYGGTIPWVGIHGLDWIYAFIHRPCVKVSATQSSFANNNHGDLETTCLCQFTFEDEVIASLQIDFLRPKAASVYGDDRVRVVGTKGVLEVRGGKLYSITEEGEKVSEPETTKDQVMEFLEEILSGNPGELTQEDIFYITDLILVARDAAESGEIVYL